jgi:hypothetical protein
MLPVVATKAVPRNRQLVMELPDIEPGTLVTVLVVPANVALPAVDAGTARRNVNNWLSDHVGHLVLGKEPRLLSDGSRTWWRVAAYVTNVHREPFGPIGFVDVDANSGQVLSDDKVAQELQHHGSHLERHPLATGS